MGIGVGLRIRGLLVSGLLVRVRLLIARLLVGIVWRDLLMARVLRILRVLLAPGRLLFWPHGR